MGMTTYTATGSNQVDQGLGESYLVVKAVFDSLANIDQVAGMRELLIEALAHAPASQDELLNFQTQMANILPRIQALELANDIIPPVIYTILYPLGAVADLPGPMLQGFMVYANHIDAQLLELES